MRLSYLISSFIISFIYLGLTKINIFDEKEWTEETRLSFLQTELSTKRPLFNLRDLTDNGMDKDILKTLRTFETASGLDTESLGAYVISQAQTASDVLGKSP